MDKEGNRKGTGRDKKEQEEDSKVTGSGKGGDLKGQEGTVRRKEGYRKWKGRGQEGNRKGAGRE